MNFSTTTEYAIKILAYMAQDETRLYTSIDIFNHLKIPFRYLRRLLTGLAKSGLIASIQGKDGGYKIARKLQDISLLDIVNSVDRKQLEGQCFFGFDACVLTEKCAMHEKWAGIRRIIREVLSTTTLLELKEFGPQSFMVNINSNS
jgi:Rrf2 family protein